MTQAPLTREALTRLVLWRGQVIFDNFAQILKNTIKGNVAAIPNIVEDTRLTWEMGLQAEMEVRPCLPWQRLGN